MKLYLIVLNVLNEDVLDSTSVLQGSHRHSTALVAPNVLNSRLLRRALDTNALVAIHRTAHE